MPSGDLRIIVSSNAMLVFACFAEWNSRSFITTSFDSSILTVADAYNKTCSSLKKEVDTVFYSMTAFYPSLSVSKQTNKPTKLSLTHSSWEDETTSEGLYSHFDSCHICVSGITSKGKHPHNEDLHMFICANTVEVPYRSREGDIVALSFQHLLETHYLLSLTASLSSLVNENYQLSIYTYIPELKKSWVNSFSSFETTFQCQVSKLA